MVERQTNDKYTATYNISTMILISTMMLNFLAVNITNTIWKTICLGTAVRVLAAAMSCYIIKSSYECDKFRNMERHTVAQSELHFDIIILQ